MGFRLGLVCSCFGLFGRLWVFVWVFLCGVCWVVDVGLLLGVVMRWDYME